MLNILTVDYFQLQKSEDDNHRLEMELKESNRKYEDVRDEVGNQPVPPPVTTCPTTRHICCFQAFAPDS